jgi:Tol biopolymer transport system component
MPRPSRLALIALTVAGTGCNKEYPNPFAQGGRTMPPAKTAAIVLTTGLWSTQANAPRELFAIDPDGANPTQLTFCSNAATPCDVLEPVPSPLRTRMMLRRLDSGAAGETLVFEDLERSAEAVIAQAAQRVSGADWSPQDGVVVYSAVGQGNLEDLYRVDPNGQNASNLTQTATVRERRPRIDPGGTVAVYERIEADGKGGIFIFQNSNTQQRVTSGGSGTDVLAATGEVVGSDSDPDFSPDDKSIVFRRLTSTGGSGLGTWDILTVRTDGTSLATLASGPIFRGAPDWGAQGILFTEVDASAGTARVVLIQPDGSGRKVLLTQPATTRLGTARWLY